MKKLFPPLLTTILVAVLALTSCKEKIDPDETPGEEIVNPTSIALNLQTTELMVGGTIQLDVVYTPDNATPQSVKWSSSNPETASVDGNGLITAKQEGTAKITAKIASGLSSTCNVTVKPAAPNAFTTLRVNYPNTTQLSSQDGAVVLTIGSYYQINVTYGPSGATDAVEYSVPSSLTDYLTVSQQGQLTPKKYYSGPITVTVKSKSGSVSQSFKVLVRDQIQEIVLVQRKGEYIGAGKTQKYKVQVYPVSAFIGDLTLSNTGSNLTATLGSDKVLTVTAANLSDSQVSTKSKTVSSTVTLKAGAKDVQKTQVLTFKFSKLDPYYPKPGDLLVCENNKIICYDGGNRGLGIIDEGNAEKPAKAFAILAFCGQAITKDNTMDNCGYYTKVNIIEMHMPDGSTTNEHIRWQDSGGIAIPVNTDGLYRKTDINGWGTSTSGEKWQGESASVNVDSKFYSSYLTHSYSEMSASHGHYAFNNTAALLQYSNSGSTDRDVRPIMYFSSSWMQNNILKTSSLRYQNYYYANNGGSYLNATCPSYADFNSIVSGNCWCTPWLLPCVSDLFTVFSGKWDVNSGLYVSGSDVTDQMAALTASAQRYNSTASYKGKTYWTSEECDKTDAWSVEVDSGVVTTHNVSKSYTYKVLPIIYFGVTIFM